MFGDVIPPVAAQITAGNRPFAGSGSLTLQDAQGAGEIKGSFTTLDTPDGKVTESLGTSGLTLIYPDATQQAPASDGSVLSLWDT
jgi:hypothetical protein